MMRGYGLCRDFVSKTTRCCRRWLVRDETDGNGARLVETERGHEAVTERGYKAVTERGYEDVAERCYQAVTERD